MSVEGIRVVLVHESGSVDEGWVSLLTELCDGVRPQLVPAEEALPDHLKSFRPHRLVALAPVSPEAYWALIERTPILAAGSGLDSLLELSGGKMADIPEDRRSEENYLMHDGAGVWSGFMEPLALTGYPATAPDKNSLPKALVVTAWNDESVALALRHRDLPLVALNFHPADLEGDLGKELVLAFLEGPELMSFPTGPPEI